MPICSSEACPCYLLVHATQHLQRTHAISTSSSQSIFAKLCAHPCAERGLVLNTDHMLKIHYLHAPLAGIDRSVTSATSPSASSTSVARRWRIRGRACGAALRGTTMLAQSCRTRPKRRRRSAQSAELWGRRRSLSPGSSRKSCFQVGVAAEVEWPHAWRATVLRLSFAVIALPAEACVLRRSRLCQVRCLLS